MGLFASNLPLCPAHQHCSEWARNYMKYCLCTRKDWMSLILGLVSVISWGIAEVPQIITNFKEKSSEGLSLGFLVTWIIGDLMNVFGCLFEPATLPTQYYTALLYLVTTLLLFSQSIHYSFIYHRHRSKRQYQKESSHDGNEKQVPNGESVEDSTASKFTPNCPIPSVDPSPEREYYTSARSLSRSHTPTVKFFHVQRTNTPFCGQNFVQEPLLGGHESRHSAPPSETKTMLCVVFTATIVLFMRTIFIQHEQTIDLHATFVKQHEGIVMQVGRKLLQVSGSLLEGSEDTQSTGIGTFLGWGMAAIYMGGRLPQICLNIRRGNVQGLNPLMFVFALVGNSTYVASILVNSIDWSTIQPNLPWVVEASGCVLLDTFILMQYVYFSYWKYRGLGTKHGDSGRIACA